MRIRRTRRARCPAKLYREHLEKIIRESRRAIGWDAPWFVAQASYHVPGDEGSDDIRAAQASLWKDGIALEGPDCDALKGRSSASAMAKAFTSAAKACAFTARSGRRRCCRGSMRNGPRLAKPTMAPSGATLRHFPECHSLGWVSANVQTQGHEELERRARRSQVGHACPQQAVTRQLGLESER